jgi:hypothetical protein
MFSGIMAGNFAIRLRYRWAPATDSGQPLASGNISVFTLMYLLAG